MTTDPDAPDSGLDLERVRQTFEESTDFTIGLEEEFAIISPDTLELEHRFPDLFEAARADPVLAPAVRGELIDTEIEIRSGRGESFADAADRQRERRDALFSLVSSKGLALAAMGTHPWANYLDQRIIDTPHYQLLQRDLGWVAQRNNTWSLHVHVGIRGADRAVAVCDWLRELLPPLLAVSANSPFLDHRDAGLHSVRTEIFTRTFPRCGVHEPFGDWESYADLVGFLVQTGTVVESTQLWWSVRPHHAFGTVEVRICDAQTLGEESFALAGLIAACVAQTALEYDERGYERGRPAGTRRPRPQGAARWQPDRGEPVARDPPRHGRLDARLPQARGGPHPRGARGTGRVDRSRAGAPRGRGGIAGTQRRAARPRGAGRRRLDRGDLSRGRG